MTYKRDSKNYVTTFDDEKVNIDRRTEKMDELRIESEFLGNITSRLLMKVISNMLGYNIWLNLQEVNANFLDGEAHIHLNVDAVLSKEEICRLLDKAGL